MQLQTNEKIFSNYTVSAQCNNVWIICMHAYQFTKTEEIQVGK